MGDGLKQALDSEHRIGGGGEIVVSPEVWPERVDEQETKDRRTKVLKMMQEDAR